MRSLLRGEGRLAAALAVGLAFLFALLVALVPIRADNDCWWHVKAGQIISRDGLPHNDVFSYAAEEDRWSNHEWLAQVVMAKVYHLGEATSLGGWRAVVLLTAITVGIGYALLCFLAGRLSRNWWIALAIAVLAVGIGRRTFYPRPPVLSNVLLALELILLIGAQERWFRRGWTWLLVPMFALWGNLHGGWLAGFVMLGAYVAQDILASLRHRLPNPCSESTSPLPPLHLLGLYTACCLALLANPFGLELLALPARVMKDAALIENIGEMRPPDLHFCVEYAASIPLVIALLAVARTRPRLGDLIILLFFLHQGMHHVRHLLLYSVAMVPLVARAAGECREWLETWVRREGSIPPSLTALAPLPFALAIAAFVYINPTESISYLERNRQYAEGVDFIEEAYPVKVCDFIEEAGFQGHMFNENYYAGYLIWRLSPDTLKVFSDSRFDIFGGRIWKEEMQITNTVGEWRALMDKWKMTFAITTAETRLAQTLVLPGSGWSLVADWSRRPTGPAWQIFTRDAGGESPATLAKARDLAARRGLAPRDISRGN